MVIMNIPKAFKDFQVIPIPFIAQPYVAMQINIDGRVVYTNIFADETANVVRVVFNADFHFGPRDGGDHGLNR